MTSDETVLRATVEDDAQKSRIDKFVATEAAVSRSKATQLLDDGLVLVAGQTATTKTKLQLGDEVAITMPTVARPDPPPMPPVIFESDELLVINKPVGLVVHAGHGHDGDTLVDALRAADVQLADVDPVRPGIVHRLDRDTSGALIVAKTLPAHAWLTEAIRDRAVKRQYVALAAGTLPDVATIDVPIARDDRHPLRFATDLGGRSAQTHLRVLAHGGLDGPDGETPVVLVHVALATGRTHQIRVHFAAAGAPVVGDALYGGPELAPRQMLHAAFLQIPHPDGSAITIEAPVPDDLRECAKKAGLDSALDGLTPDFSEWAAGA